MKILMFNTNNPLKGSGSVAFDLFNQLKNQGHEVKLLVNSYSKDYPDGVISVKSFLCARWESNRSKFERRLNKLKKTLNIKEKNPINSDYSFIQLNEQKQIYTTKRLLKLADNKVDIIILLWVCNFINARNIYELYRETQAKIFWLLYDMAPLTGGCNYAWDCKGYQNNCGNCPGLYSSDSFDISFKNLQYKKKFISKTNIQIIAGSEWQYRQAKGSSLFLNKTINKILTSVDSNIFKPCDQGKLRLRLGIPTNKKVLFFGAVGLKNGRKGMSYLIQSMHILKDKIKNFDTENEILLLIAGRDIQEIIEYLPFEYLFLGMLDNSYGIASAYQAADIFICPSIEDSGPTMINQSLMCGTPVVCFEMGVAIDLVINGKTGYYVKLRDSNAMAQAIYDVLCMNDFDYLMMKENCRDLALRLYHPDVNKSNWDKILS